MCIFNIWFKETLIKIMTKYKQNIRKWKSERGLNKIENWSSWQMDEFRNTRNHCIRTVRNARDDYYKKLSKNISECNDSRKWWNMVNKISNTQIRNDLPPLEVNGNVVDNNFEKATAFNIFFYKSVKYRRFISDSSKY